MIELSLSIYNFPWKVRHLVLFTIITLQIILNSDENFYVQILKEKYN